MNWRKVLEQALGNRARFGEFLSLHTSYRIGGPAEAYAVPDSEEHLALIQRLRSEEGVPVFVIGKGTNLLVSDAGLKGIVVDLADVGHWVEVDGVDVRVGAGYDWCEFVQMAASKGLAGVEALAGIPGTVGGAAIMNAGAFGVEFFDIAFDIDVMTSTGEVERVARQSIAYGYRCGYEPGDTIVLAAHLRLEKGDRESLRVRISEILARRQARQPLEYPSCGSVFKRPPGDFAGRLIEACGCKGLRVGDAQVSPKHANFIVNLGQATAKDVVALMREVRRRVFDRFGVLLEPEVRLVGFEESTEELIGVDDSASGSQKK